MTAPRIPKISQPVIQSHIPRKKAYDSLDKLWDRPVIWISAPAGSGKTTLVASYLQLRATPCLWYQLDEHDSCLATFFHYLQLVLRHACDADHPALDSDRKNLWAFETSAWKDFAQYLTALPKIIDKIYTEHSSWAEEKKKQEKILIQGQTGAQSAAHQGRISESAGSRLKCLVLDNYHELPEDSPLHGFLATALHCLPADLKLIIISRHPPGAQFARLRANRLLALLGWTELKFSLQETRALISLVLQSAQHKNQTKGPDFQKNGQQQDPADQEIIAGVAHDITQGWAAGLVLLAEGLNSGHIQLASWGKLELPREILQYFDQEVCSRIDTRGLDLLLKTSFLTWMTPEMAQTLSGEQQAGAILEDLHRKNCFTDKCIQDTVYYQYHLLFRDFLQHKAKHVLSCAQISQLQQQTALVLAGRGYLQEAVELLFRAVNYEAAAQIVLDQAQDMLQQGLCNSLEVWLKQLPRELYAKYPWLHYWSGMCWQLVQPEQALLSFQQAFDAFVQVRDYAGALLSWSGAVDSILVGGDNFRQLDSWVQWLNNHLAQNAC